MVAGNACPEVQVFHRQYSENQTKRMAKSCDYKSYLFSISYGVVRVFRIGTGRPGYTPKCNFRTIASGAGKVSNGTGTGGMDLPDRFEHLK